MKNIIGCLTGEMGWIIATEIPYYRWLSKKHPVVLVGPEWCKYLCSDFVNMYVPHDYKSKNGPDNWVVDRYPTVRPYIPKGIMKSLRSGFADEWSEVVPDEKRCMSKKKKKYRKYGDFALSAVPILIHARTADKYGQEKRNWSTQKWESFVSAFADRYIASIGSAGGAHHINGTMDWRGIRTKDLCTFTHNAVVVGTSSGPMHLASHCGAPHVVITGKEPQKALGGKTNRYRYEKLWNPFNTPCTVLDSHKWQPPVDVVVNAVKEYL